MSTLYKNSLQKLFSRNSNPKLGLTRIASLLTAIGFKRDDFKIIQIVGTNGKGSTSAFCESLLLAHQKSCALFTSPHLSSARERIRINGQMVSEEEFSKAVDVVSQEADTMSDEPSFFECLLAMFVYIAKKAGVQVLVAEAGLGGRLDATTALKAHVLGLTTVAIDHQNVLGETIEEIATEKIMAAYDKQRVISVAQEKRVRDVISIMQQKIGCTLSYAPPAFLPLGLVGEHQTINAGLAVELVNSIGIGLNERAVATGLINVKWPGRYEKVRYHEHTIIFDGAHNPSGMRALNNALSHDQEIEGVPLILVFGTLKSATTKEKTVLVLNNKFAEIVIHVSDNPRRESFLEVSETLMEKGVEREKISLFSTWEEVLAKAQKNRATVLVCGSLYTVGELRAKLLGLPIDHLIPNF